MDNIYTVAIIGCGQRGFGYGRHMAKMPDKYKIVSICDPDSVVRNKVEKLWNINKNDLFDNEDEFFQKNAQIF